MSDGQTKKTVPPPLPTSDDVGETANAAPVVDKMGAFLNKAGAVISLERGINARSRVKIAALADEFELDEDQLDQAMGKLLGGAATKEKKLSRAELRDLRRRKRAYQNTIGETLMALPGGVLTASMERMLVAAGADEHDLPEEDAQHEVVELASKLRVRRITEDEAIRHIKEVAAAKIGPSGVLRDDVRQRIYAEASRWGLTPDQVEPIIKSCVSTVRQGERREHYRMVGLISVSAAVLMGVLLMILWMAFSSALPETDEPIAVVEGDEPADGGSSEGESSGGEDSSSPSATPSRWGVPKWWDEELSSHVANARLRMPESGNERETDLYQLRAPEGKQRAAAYKRLAARAQQSEQTDENQAILGGLLAAAYALEPDDAAASQIRTELMAAAGGPGDKLPENVDAYYKALWGVETAIAALMHEALPPERSSALVDGLQRKLQASIEAGLPPAQLQRQIMTAASVHLYKSLTRAADENVQLAADLYEQLLPQIRPYLSTAQLERLSTDYLVAVLPGLGEEWIIYEALLRTCAQSEDPLNVLKLVDVLERTTNSALQSYLSAQLALRAGVGAASLSIDELAAEVRTALGAAELTRPKDGAQRAKQWMELADASIAASPASIADPMDLLQQTVEKARLSALAAAIEKGELGAADVDRLWDEEAPNIEDGSSASRSPRRTSRLSGAHLKTLDRTIGALRNYNRIDKFARLAYLRNVASFTSTVTDVTPEQGQDLATYLAAAKAVDEHQQVMSLAEGILRWKMVRLGLADQLEGSRLREEHMQELLKQALLRDVELSDGWQRRLGNELLAGVARQLATEESLTRGRTSPYDRAAEALTEYYQMQARLAGIAAEAYREASSPADVLMLLTPQQAARVAAVSPAGEAASLRERTENELAALDYLGGNDLTRTAALSRMWIDLKAAELQINKPGRASDVGQILIELDSSNRRAEHVLEQLHAQEQAMLKLMRVAVRP